MKFKKEKRRVSEILHLYERQNNLDTIRESRWIGAKVGFFFVRNGIFNDAGSADIDWFRIE